MLTEQDILAAAQALRDGELVAFPTETVYGLGANALNPIAVAKIFEIKERPRFDPLIVHVADVSQADEVVESIPEIAQSLMEKFWPGPLSFVLNKLPCVPDIVTAGLPGVAIRCPSHDVARGLIRAAGVPIAAPSANRFGLVSPTTGSHVMESFGDRLSFVLDDGPCKIGVESTVVSFMDTNDGLPKLLRHGGITQEQIESVTGVINTQMHEESQPTSPGQLSRHYSPATPLLFSNDDSLAEMKNGKSKIGLLGFQSPSSSEDFAAIEILSKKGDYREAAANLFAAMRRLDALGLDLIIAEPIPEIDLGRAIMDRLRRAAAR
jgi:L-threonylcarbamoyladenylate synthase